MRIKLVNKFGKSIRLIFLLFGISALIISTYFLVKGSSIQTSKNTPPLTTFNTKVLADYRFPKCSRPNLAFYDPSDYAEGIVDINSFNSRPNNKVGLYVYPEEGLIVKADEMINSNGGDWGYVLLPFNVQELDTEKWFKIFMGLSELHLIPVVQLWNINSYSDIKSQTDNTAEFLADLPWPTNNWYVSVYNEPNDKNFWQGRVDPENYAVVLGYTVDKLHQTDSRFFVLNGAFNASARTGRGYLSEDMYLLRMNSKVPGIFNKLDGWASHPYPQPNFSGKPTDKGRDSITAYDWELLLLKHYFGINRYLPVFITETGWPHAEGEEIDTNYLPEETVASYYKYAFENVWLKDPKVVAIMPFTIIYNTPYDHFSFLKNDRDSVYKQFDVIKSIKKTAGYPELSNAYFDYIKTIPACAK